MASGIDETCLGHRHGNIGVPGLDLLAPGIGSGHRVVAVDYAIGGVGSAGCAAAGHLAERAALIMTLEPGADITRARTSLLKSAGCSPSFAPRALA